MKITDISTSKPVGKSRKRSNGVDASGFDDVMEGALSPSSSGEVSASSAPASPSALTGMDALIAMQSLGGKTQKKEYQDIADDMLDRLDVIRKGIMLGAVPEHILQDLASKTSKWGQLQDDAKLHYTELACVITDIRIRAEVELAKLRREGGATPHSK